MKSVILLLPVAVSIVFFSVCMDESYPQAPEVDEVTVHAMGVEIPLNRILLIRKENYYCAIRFIHAWSEVDQKLLRKFTPKIRQGGITAESARKAALKTYASYESYYEKDGKPSFIDVGIRREERTASLLPLRGPFRPFVYQPGNGCVECGPFKLLWEFKSFVSFIPLGKSSNIRDYGFEIAPTPWININQVNVKDPRIKWYRFDNERKSVSIPIDKLWE